MQIICENLTLKYPQSETCVFKDLTFRLNGPGFHALFGPSGVGKTSIAKMISGLLTHYNGNLKVLDNSDSLPPTDTSLHRPPDVLLREHDPKHPHLILYSHNMERLPGWSSVGRHIDKITPSSLVEKKERLTVIFGLENLMGLRFNQLSLGQKNRVNLVRYLLQDFKILIMDESLANVDEMTREQILLSIKEMFPQALFLYISHNVVEVSKFCKEIIVFRGVHKSPQVLTIMGQDYRKNETLAPAALNRTMLEIMNAS